MTDSQACPECGADVPAGRLSCRACGALFASVLGRGRSEEGPAVGPGGGADEPEGWEARPERPAAVEPLDAPRPVIGDDDAAAADRALPEATQLPAERPLRSDLSLPADEPVERAAVVVPPVDAPLEATAQPMPPMPPIPGAYLPPSAIVRHVPAPAREPVPAAAPLSPEPVTDPVPGGLRPGEAADSPGARPPVLELPFSIAPGTGPRLVAAGAAIGVVAFVLPWVPGGGIVIGGAFGTGYFATWGLAALGNLVAFLLAGLSLALAVFPNRVPRYAALGLLPVSLGGAFAGFGWIYATAPAGTGIGIWALAAAACLLLAGGSLVIRARHAES